MDGIKIEGGAMESLVAKAVIDAMTPEAQQELITNAVKSLLMQDIPANPNDRYSQVKISRVQSMFNTAAQQVAEKIIRDELANSEEFKVQIKMLFGEIADKLFNNQETRKTLIDKIADAVSQNITRY